MGSETDPKGMLSPHPSQAETPKGLQMFKQNVWDRTKPALGPTSPNLEHNRSPPPQHWNWHLLAPRSMHQTGHAVIWQARGKIMELLGPFFKNKSKGKEYIPKSEAQA